MNEQDVGGVSGWPPSIGLMVFDHKLDLPAIMGLALIIAGVLTIHLFSDTVGH